MSDHDAPSLPGDAEPDGSASNVPVQPAPGGDGFTQSPEPPIRGVESEASAPGWGQSYLGQPGLGQVSPSEGGHGAIGGLGQGSETGPGTPAMPVRRGPKPIRGPRFSAMPLIAGLGLLGLLMTIVIMVILMGKVLDGVSPSEKLIVKSTIPTHVPGVVDPDATTQSSQQVPPGGGQIASAEAQVCQMNERVLQTAADAYQALNGVPPTNQQALLDEELLKGRVPNFEVSAAGDTFAITASGPCT